MFEELISFETAKLAKEKGFIEVANYPMWFHENGKEAGLFEDLWNVKKHEYFTHECIIRPTQSLLQKWLRETHNIHVYVNYREFGIKSCNGYYYGSTGDKYNSSRFDSYEEALEEGLKEGLKLIKC